MKRRLSYGSILVLFLFALSFYSACGANSGSDGAAGAAGEAGEAGVPGPAGEDGSGAGSAPQSPSGLTAEAISPSQIDVRWVFNTGAELGFNVQRSEGDDEWETIAGTAANVTVYHDESVECEHEYSYRVLAYNDYGESAPSNEESATADYCELDAPGDMTALLDDEQEDGAQRAILLSWSEGAGELPGVPGSYEIYRKTFDGAWSATPLAAQPSDQTTYTDEDAACGQTFQYRVRAANENSVKSAFSNTATSRADACPLVDPSNLVATTDQAGSIDITWDINDPDATGYLLQRREHEARAEWVTIADLPEGSTTYSDEGAQCETAEYDYRLRAYNGDKQSAWIETLTPGSSYCPVEAPSGLYANVLGPNAIELSWINNADNATGIRIYRDDTELTTLSPGATSYNDDTVDCQTVYRYTVTAYTMNVESDFTNAEAAQSGWCPVMAPYNVTTVGDGNEVTVSWEHDQQYVESFDVQRRTEGEGLWQLLDTVSAPDTNVTDTTVECYANYEYRVLAYNSNVESGWSESATGAAIGCIPMRPQPVLNLISPLSYIALSRDYLENPPDPLYPLTITGEGIAEDTKVEIGDFLLDCDTGGAGTDCLADGLGQPENCATDCVVSLPDDIMKYAATYVVRIFTPTPVFNGLNTSEDHDFFNVVAPMPEITRIWPRGVMQLVDEDSYAPIAREVTLEVRGRNIMDNAQFRLENNFGELLDPGIETDPDSGEQYAHVRLSTHDLFPRASNYEFAVVNPSPGGGQRTTPFGIKPLIEDWNGQTVQYLDACSESGPTPISIQAFSIPRQASANAVGWNGEGRCIAARDDFGRLMTRFPSDNAPSVSPAPVGAFRIEVQDDSGIGITTALSDSSPIYRGGDGTFGDATSFAMGDFPGQIFASDFNGDGATDIVTADLRSSTVSIRLGNGDGTFQEKTALSTGNDPNSVYVSDVNRDGNPDILTADLQNDTVSIRLGNGDGSFGERITVPMGEGTNSVSVSDFNRDGDPDIVTADRDQGTISIRLGDGAGNFGERSIWPMGESPVDVAVSDFNGDGAQDVVSADLTSDALSVRLGDGDGSFGEITTLPTGDFPYFVCVSDLNGDGAPDIVNTDSDSDTVSIRLGNGDGTFNQRTTLATGNFPMGVAVSDMNGDGLPDLIVANYLSSTVSIRFGNGDGSFGEQFAFSMGVYPPDVFVSDFNGDGAPDFVTGDSQSDSISIRMGNGAGDLGQRIVLATDPGPISVFASDFNGDDAPDIINVNNGAHTVSVRLGNGDGSFGEKTSWSTGAWPRSIFAADLNGDDAPDIITTDMADNTISIRLGNGDGTFGERSTLETGATPISIYISDFNGDDAPDIVSADEGSNTISVHLGIGDGSFQERTPLLMDSGPVSIVAADFNGDHAQDIATTDTHVVFVSLGNGDGTFGDMASWPMGDNPQSLFAADVSGDDATDIIAADSDNDAVYIRFGNGDGTFGEATSYSTGDEPISVFVADLNGDEAPDIVTADLESDALSIRLNNGSGSFMERTIVPAGESPFSVFASDFDGDGTPDLATADYWSDTVSIRLLGFPGTWRQELTDSFSDDPDQPWLPKYAEVGYTDLDIHQYRQTITKVGVTVFLEWTTQPAGTVGLGLVAPDGQMVDLGSHGDFTPWPDDVNPTSWRLNKTFREYDFNGELGIAGLVDLHGLQPTDYWTLSIDNQTGAPAEVKNFTVITDGSF